MASVIHIWTEAIISTLSSSYMDWGHHNWPILSPSLHLQTTSTDHTLNLFLSLNTYMNSANYIWALGIKSYLNSLHIGIRWPQLIIYELRSSQVTSAHQIWAEAIIINLSLSYMDLCHQKWPYFIIHGHNMCSANHTWVEANICGLCSSYMDIR